jgi:type II secretion system (T2SS) protein E
MRRTIEDVLIDAGLMDEARLRRVRRFARHNAVCLVRAVVEHGGLDEELLAATLAEQLRLPRVDLARAIVDDDAIREVPYDLAEQRRVLPLVIERSDPRRVIRVVMADPLDFDATEEIEMSTGCRVEPEVARVSEIAAAVVSHYRGVITKMIPRRAPFGSLGTTTEALPPDPTTQPHHLVSEEASAELGLRALVEVLADRGIIDREVWHDVLRRLVKEQAGE